MATSLLGGGRDVERMVSSETVLNKSTRNYFNVCEFMDDLNYISFTSDIVAHSPQTHSHCVYILVVF